MNPENPFEQPFDEPSSKPPGGDGNPVFFGNPVSPQGYGQAPLPLEQVPNAVAVLVLGILSLVFMFCYGFGFIFSLIALGLSGRGRRVYQNEPSRYQPGSYAMLKSGRICALISLIVCIFFIAIVVIAIIFGIMSENGPRYY